MATLEPMSSHHNFRPGHQNKLVSEPPIATPDDHAQLVEADQRFQAALDKAIATGPERIAAVDGTAALEPRTKPPEHRWPQAPGGGAARVTRAGPAQSC